MFKTMFQVIRDTNIIGIIIISINLLVNNFLYFTLFSSLPYPNELSCNTQLFHTSLC